MQVTVLATTDIHGFVPIKKTEDPGLFALNQLKAAYDRPILIDNGDFLIGSPLATYLNQACAYSPLIDLANEIGFDVMVPGNHDFDHGPEFLLKQVEHFQGDYVCANVLNLSDELLFKPYTIIERFGKKVGIIGLITSAMPQISRFEAIRAIKFIDVIETLKKWLPIVRQQADIIVVSYHGGIEKDMVTHADTQYDTGEDQAYRILATFPDQIDGLICGHQHRLNKGKTYGCAFVQPGYRGQFVGCLTFALDACDQLHTQAELLPTASYSKAVWQLPDLTAYEKWLDTQIDLTLFKDYLASFFSEKYAVIKFSGNRIKDILQTFSCVYTVYQYHLTGQELLDVSDELPNNDLFLRRLPEKIDPKADYQVLSNCPQFPTYRIAVKYIDNIFDEFLYFSK